MTKEQFYNLEKFVEDTIEKGIKSDSGPFNKIVELAHKLIQINDSLMDCYANEYGREFNIDGFFNNKE